MITAKLILTGKETYDPEYPTVSKYDALEAMVEFAKLHVEAALKEALENSPTGSSTDIPSYEDMEDAILRMAARSDTLDEAKIRAAAKPFDSVAVVEHAVQIYHEAIDNTK